MNGKNCQNCELNGKKKILGIGSSRPLIVFVSDCPSEQDEMDGKPFNNNGDKLFLSLLRQVGIPIEKCYFTNLISCVPKRDVHNNLVPKSTVIKCCSHELKERIAQLNPKIVVLLGNFSIKYFLGTKYNILNTEGVPFKKDNRLFVTTYSPNLLIKDIDKTDTVKKTLVRIKDWLSNDPFERWDTSKYKLLTNYNDIIAVLSFLEIDNEWSCDIETDGLDFLHNDIYSIAFSSPNITCAFPLRNPDGSLFFSKEETNYIIKKLTFLMANHSNKIFHNSGFDLLFLYKYGIVCNNLYADTMIMHYLLDSGSKNYGLKYLVWKVLGKGGYEQDYTSVSSDRSARGIDTKLLLTYNCHDAYATYLLYKKTEEEIQQLFPKLLVCMRKLILPLQLVLIETTFHGLRLDVDYIKFLDQKYKFELEQVKKELYSIVGMEFNLNSTKELANILYNKLKLPLNFVTDSNKPSTDFKTLNLLKGNKFVDLLLDYRKKQKLISTYFSSFIKAADKQNIIHPKFLIFGTVSGRLSSYDPNCQNIPRNSEIKNMFIARDNHVLVECDFSQIEYRMWCHYCQDNKMKQDIENGFDIHRLVASKVFNISMDQVDDEKRKIAKFTVFGAMYGRGAKSIALEHKISEQQAENILKFFFSLYPRANLWLKQIVALAKQRGYLETFFGRIKRFPGINSDIFSIRSASEREARNFVLQSTAADYTLFRAVLLKKHMEQYDSRLVLTVHDSLIYEIPETKVEEAVSVLLKYLSVPLRGINVRMDFESKIGYKLGELKMFKNISDIKPLLNELKNGKFNREI